MSRTFEVLPTKDSKIKCVEVINSSIELLNNFLNNSGVSQKFKVTVKEIAKEKIDYRPQYLTFEEGKYMVFDVNNEGEVYIFYNRTTELDITFWEEEMQSNVNAKRVRDKIETNLDLGFSWTIKRTMGQPAIVNLYYGYLAIAIAKLTEGVIYTDDGAWDFSIFPAECDYFEENYLNNSMLNDKSKNEVYQWLSALQK